MFSQNIPPQKAGFTLVEILIVILIILALTQLGNIGVFFQTRDASTLEEMAVKIIAATDESKLQSLLGKTHEKNIVRSHQVVVDWTNAGTLELSTSLNLSKDTTDTLIPLDTTSWNLPGLKTTLWNCPEPTALPENITHLEIVFHGDTLTLTDDADTPFARHTVIQFAYKNRFHEIHIDSRTGLIFERQWSETFNCNIL